MQVCHTDDTLREAHLYQVWLGQPVINQATGLGERFYEALYHPPEHQYVDIRGQRQAQQSIHPHQRYIESLEVLTKATPISWHIGEDRGDDEPLHEFKNSC